ncbi:MAG TPA: hypothetical protein VIT65_05460 [Microlunatus sp.]
MEVGDEAARAMSLAADVLDGLGRRPEDLRIVLVENLLSGPDASPARWRVTLKARDLLPAGQGKIGKGGELVIEVDLTTGDAHQGRGGD